MALDLALFGDKVRRLREAFEEEVDDLARATGIAQVRLRSFEAGQDSPTGDEVLILADHFKEDFRFFISNEQRTVLERTEKLFRAHSAELSKSDRWSIQEFLFLCDNEAFLMTELGRSSRLNFSAQVGGTYFRQHGWDAAHQLRQALRYRERDVPSDLFHDVRQLGFHVFRRQLENSNLSGLFIDHPAAGPCLLINYSEDVYRQRFTAAHEAAHAIFDRDDEFVVSFSKWTKDNLREVRADAFASAYLVPPQLLQGVEVSLLTETRLLDLADQLKVSVRALVMAFIRDKHIPKEDWEKYKHVRLPRGAKHDPELPASLTGAQRARKLTLLKRGLSTAYVDLCFEAFQRNVVTRAKLAEMLLGAEASRLSSRAKASRCTGMRPGKRRSSSSRGASTSKPQTSFVPSALEKCSSFREARPHGFACTSPEPGRLLTISSPAQVFEAFVADTSAANNDPAIDVRAVFERHGLELL